MPGLSPARSDQPVQLRGSTVRVGAGVVASGWLLRRVWRLLVVTVATPAALAGMLLVVLGGLLWSVSPLLMLCLAVLGVGILVGVRVVRPDRWLAWLRLPLRSWWRGWFIWDTACRAQGRPGHRRPPLLAAGIVAPETEQLAAAVTMPDRLPRFAWTDTRPDARTYARVLLGSIAERQKWRQQYEAAKAAAPAVDNVPATAPPPDPG